MLRLFEISTGTVVRAAAAYVADTTAPTLVSSTLNLNARVVTAFALLESETVDGTTFDPTHDTLQASSSYSGLPGSSIYALTGGSPLQARSPSVTLTLSDSDLNVIKLRPRIAITYTALCVCYDDQHDGAGYVWQSSCDDCW